MAIFRKGKGIYNQLHEGKTIKQIYHIGKKYLVEWLSSATIAAIEVVFGEEAKQVIADTNTYLLSIALTDTTRAQQLAMFINEDPLLVCSLVETSKMRWLWNETTAYIDLDIPVNQNLRVEAYAYQYAYANDQNALFSAGTNNAYGFHIWSSGWKYGKESTWTFGARRITGQNLPLDTPFKVESNGGTLTYTLMDGSVFGTLTNSESTFSYSTKLRIFGLNYNGSLYPDCNLLGGMDNVKVWSDGNNLHLCPFIRNGENGMLDIISGTFHPNANTSGAFTIQLTDK